MARKRRDTYEQWEAAGILEEKLKYIEKLASERIVQSAIAEALNISAKTFTELKLNHPRIYTALDNGSQKLRVVLENTLIKVALGYDYYEDDQAVEEVNGKPRKKIVKVKKYRHPDLKALKIVLLNKFGNEYNDRRFDYELMNKVDHSQ